MARDLQLETRMWGGCLVVKVVGESARSECARFLNAVRHGVSPGARRVVVDLRKLERMSASSLGELAEAHQILADAGCQLVLACPSGQVRRLLVLSFLDKLIKTADSIEAAVADEQAGGSANGAADSGHR